MTQEVIVMNGSELLPRHMSPSGYNVGHEGNLSINVSTRGGPSWVSGFAIESWRLPLPSRLLSQAALKVQSRHGKRWKLRWKSDDEDKNYRGIGARKWVLRVLLTREHAGILPNQSNPPKLTLLVRHPMIPYGTLCAPHPWLSPEGAPKRESVVWRFSVIDVLKITQMVFAHSAVSIYRGHFTLN